ncbi:hypothetical protein LOK49_LG14G00152 [Camellia lanceoleosa]|uniref:Uncharacterized protein n=1 Tax=Camellia lanceoleosa TaxID=1840588 RepID=A0ACC0FDE7_9ERIC|nr:hypothetical protein LOK49_LG14G00152 [Camellia lanceoleosa]
MVIMKAAIAAARLCGEVVRLTGVPQSSQEYLKWTRIWLLLKFKPLLGLILMLGSSLTQVDQCLTSKNLLMSTTYQGKVKPLKYKRPFTVQASVDSGRPSSASIFVGGFVLGGIVVGALGCIYAPQISKALAGADRKDLMRKLPKFIYDEEKALERTRKILTEKIAQMNFAIDDVSS